MFDRLLMIEFAYSKNCFCYLSPNNIKELQGKTVKICYGNNKQAYLSVDASVKIADDQVIGISSLYARALGLKENEAVTVSEVYAVPTIHSLTIFPLSMDDYDVMEVLSESIQSTLLNQVRVLSNNQKVVIWIGKTLFVTVNVCDIEPMSPGRIDNLVEVTIKKPNEVRRYEPEPHVTPPPANKNISTKKVKVGVFPHINDILAPYASKTKQLIVRLASASLIPNVPHKLNPFNVFISNDQLGPSIKSGQIYCMTPVQLTDNNKSIYVQLHIIENLDSNQFVNLYVHDDILSYFNCTVGSRVKLEPHSHLLPDVEHIEIYCKRRNLVSVDEIFKDYLGQNCKTHPAVLNADFPFTILQGMRCYVRFEPEKWKFCIVSGDFIRNCKFSVNSDAVFHTEPAKKQPKPQYIRDVCNFDSILNQSEIVVDTAITGRMNNLLITGGGGRGKTTLLNIIEDKFIATKSQIYIRKLNCNSLKGKTIESFQKFLTKTLVDMVHLQPCVLLLDDIDVLCQDEGGSETAPQNMVYFDRISEMLEGLLNMYCKQNIIGVIMTAESPYKLNKNIFGTRGNNFFKLVYTIDNLNKNDRKQILKELFASHSLNRVSLDSLADTMESFVFQDVKDFVNKALYEAYEEDYQHQSLVVTEEHCKNAFEATTVTSLHDINLSSSGSKDFNDVGGLDDIKDVLIETLFWPSKYSNLFSNAPLRLPTGLLLYGPPGTGKTLIAAAAAKQCGLRLISIKGPELLSKYIGASEQAVRDVFQKAQGAKPCVLFFDEFDSLAPRRGHDNTGVTDRVVNQLLTQLDGVESLSGVFVLAATSRPDLLDPALLRPGRLDRHVFCPLPDRDCRLSILRALSRSMKFSSDVNLEEIADQTKSFSGADLQSLLYSAQLSTVDDLLSSEVYSEETVSEIDQNQLKEALRTTKPSVTQQERVKFDKIYKKFKSGGTEDFAAGSRATLA